MKEIAKIVGPGGFAIDPANRLLYSRDMMMGAMLERKAGIAPHLPDLICWPGNSSEIAKILRLAAKRRIPVIPYGAGSGVSGGTIPVRRGIILDLKRMNKIGKVRETSTGYSVTAETGIIGEHLERRLNLEGFTLGHFPSSILCATLGGYLACRSAGQLSSKYGKIEDMVEKIETVLPDGTILRCGERLVSFPGVRPRDLFPGTEGCLGVITRARLRVHPLPPVTRYRGVSFNRLEDGLRAIREIMQEGLRPAVVRLYDPLDSLLLRHGYQAADKGPSAFDGLRKIAGDKIHNLLFKNPCWFQKLIPYLIPPEVVLILGIAGEPRLAEAQEKKALAICRRSITRDLGEGPGLHWLRHRYSVSFKMPELLERGCFVDTIEVATHWSNLLPLYRKIREVLTRRAILLAHFSHAYPEGCSIYFTIVGKCDSQERRLYRKIWDEAMEGCLAAGATISHHHGIGLLKAKYLPRELGAAMDFYRGIKKRLDRGNIMNPGKMALS